MTIENLNDKWIKYINRVTIWNHKANKLKISRYAIELAQKNNLQSFVGLDYHCDRQMLPIYMEANPEVIFTDIDIASSLKHFLPMFLGLNENIFCSSISYSALCVLDWLRIGLLSITQKIRGKKEALNNLLSELGLFEMYGLFFFSGKRKKAHMNDYASPAKKSVVLLGASFNTGNLGVNALAWSSIRIIRARWPDARVVLVGVNRTPGVSKIQFDGQWEEFLTWPVRYCSNLLAPHHIAQLYLAIVFYRFFPFLKKRLTKKNSMIGEIFRCDLVCDITGGDSFSDIYGLSRLFRGYLLKRTCQMTGKPFILLPQTYGPFKTALARRLARTILERTAKIYSRDQEGIAVVEELIGPSRKVRLCPDVAFIMEPVRPVTAPVARLEQLKGTGQRLIGLNISGLLYHGGYTRDNMFGLACNYPELVREIIAFFTGQANVQVLLVPHVLPDSDFAVEDDLVAAQHALQGLPPEIQSKVIVLERGYDQNETKYVIGLCDFFLGARMHATIAALSQGIPAVAMAYSRKFAGVFATAGVADCALDLRTLTNDQMLHGIMSAYRRRGALRAVLAKTVPELKNLLFHMFDGIDEPAAVSDNQEVSPAFQR